DHPLIYQLFSLFVRSFFLSFRFLSVSGIHFYVTLVTTSIHPSLRQFWVFIEADAATLTKFASTIDTDKLKTPSSQMILTAVGNLTYQQEVTFFFVSIR
ncbi:hypothetical protein, partial [Bacteroides pyogenes]|uniref:hypothetical protein n=1 Tax=Bacteroides pyogenes TaxID=310300 RepID=UPI003D160A94